MRGVVALCGLACVCLHAADVTGKWSGAVLPGNNGDSVPISFEMRQKGDRVIGVAITNESGVCELLNGAVAGPKVSFDIQVDKEVVHFELASAGEKLSGQALGKRDDGKADGPVAINLDRQTPSHTGPFSGTWTGVAEGVEDGQKRFEYFSLILRQTGADVSGAITDPAGSEHALKNVKIAGDRVSFEVDRLQASLSVAGDKLTGTGTVNSGSGDQLIHLVLNREPPPTSGVSGRWAGIGEFTENGASKRFPIYFQLQQSISGLAGKCIDNDGKAFDVTSGSVHGNKLVFDIASGTDRVHFDLVLDGDELSGQGVWSGNNTILKVTAVRRME